MDTENSVIRFVGVKKGEIEVLQENEIRLIEKPRRLVSWFWYVLWKRNNWNIAFEFRQGQFRSFFKSNPGSLHFL